MNTKNKKIIENYKHIRAIIIATTITIYKYPFIYAYNMYNYSFFTKTEHQLKIFDIQIYKIKPSSYYSIAACLAYFPGTKISLLPFIAVGHQGEGLYVLRRIKYTEKEKYCLYEG